MRRRTMLQMATTGLLVGAGAESVQLALRTGFGSIMLSLQTQAAPLSAGAFLAAVDAGAYQGSTFTRVVRPDNDHGSPRIAVVQGAARDGGPTPKPITHETTQRTGLRHLNGTLSLPRGAVGTATGGEFFICVGDQPALDFGGGRTHDGQGFAAFGQVRAGMDIVRRIWSMDANGSSPDSYTRGQMLRVAVPILQISRV